MDEAQAFPKPQRRVKDAKTVARYRAQHRVCECGCHGNRALEVHHIVSRKMGGGDLDENLLVLTASCHAAWHTWGGREWFRRRETRMADDACAKIRAALRLDDA